MNQRFRGVGRYGKLITLIILLLILLAVRLFMLTMVQHDRWIDEASAQTTKTLYTSAPRGNIYDRNGNLLAGNRQVFNVVFNASNLTTEEINDSSLKLINKLIENGDEYSDDFPIVIKENGSFSYTFDDELDKWLTDHGFYKNTPASRVFETYLGEYDISPDMDRYEAMDELREKHNIYLPINVRTMKYTYRINKENFWSRFGIYLDEDGEKDARECFHELREDYRIDSSLSDTEARKIFVVRNKVAANSYQKYLPLTIATDISDLSVVYFKEMNLPGVDVSSETVRYYPYGNVGCHIIGYMGAISDSEIEYYVDERNYMISDLVGKDGIESALEEKLHGTPGITTVRVNSYGSYVNTISEQDGKKGQDVYLTIMVELQKATEKALKSVVEENEHARSGAAVVLEVKTGNVSAMASYPDFDLNTFADGISSEEWESVQPENPRDSLSPTPLYNNATRTAVAPGSTFKPITALAALSCGLDPELEIEDQGHIDIGDRSFGCSAWNELKATDGIENLEWGIGNSCNYYFACIATAKDWGTNESLGYQISIDDILNKARDYGLFDETGIEIGDVSRNPVSAETKMRNYRYAVWQALEDKASVYFAPEVYQDTERLEENITKIANWIYENPDYAEVIERIDNETDVLDSQVENCAAMVKFDYFIQAEWTTFDLFNICIGQGDNNYTPLQIANYIATLGNHGMRNKVSLIYGIEGEGRKIKEQAFDTGTSEEARSAVLTGMRRVCTSGTLRDTFGDFGIKVIGKTGTAEYQSIKQPKDEVEYIKNNLEWINKTAGTSIKWEEVEEKMKELLKSDANLYPTENDTVDQALIMLSDRKITQNIIDNNKETYEDFAWVVTMAPYENPEIAVVVFLPEGGYGSEASQAAKDIISAYYNLDGQLGESTVHIPTADNGVNTLN